MSPAKIINISSADDTLDEYKEDMMLMFNNARIYNEEGSVVWKDANAMQEAMFDKLNEMMSGYAEPSMHNGPMVKRVPESDEE